MAEIVTKSKEKVHTSINRPKMGIVGNFGVGPSYPAGRTFVLRVTLTTEETAALSQ